MSEGTRSVENRGGAETQNDESGGKCFLVDADFILDGSASLQQVRSGPLVIAGGLVLLVGVGVYGRCLWEFVQKGQGIPAPIDHPKALVVTGLYRYVRNPMYLGVFAILIGEVLTLGSRALFVYAAVWLLVVHIVILVYEEPNLRARFGDSYEQYCAHVRRWVPGRPYVY